MGLLDLLGTKYRVIVTPPLQAPSIALAVKVYENLSKAGIASTVVAHNSIAAHIPGKDTSLLLNVHTCSESDNIDNIDSEVILLWCEPPSTIAQKIVFAAGVEPSRLSVKLRRLYLRRIGQNLYLAYIRSPKGLLQEYFTVVNGIIQRSKPPCPSELLEELCSYAVAGRLSVRDAVDVIAAFYGVKRGEARRALAELAEKGCIRLSSGYIMLQCEEGSLVS